MKMTRTRYIASAFILAALGMNFSPAGQWGMSVAHAEAVPAPAAETVRPEVGKLLTASQDLLKAKKYKEALDKLGEVDAIAGKTSYETYIVDRTRVAIASASADDALSITSLEAVIASNHMQADEKMVFMQALAGAYYRQKDYAKAIVWLSRYLKEPGSDAKLRPLLIQSYYLNNEYARAVQELRVDMQADEAAGKAPTEDQLKLLASCALKTNDKVGYVDALEKFVAYYPKQEYWLDLLTRVQTKPTYADRLNLDVYRLKLATGLLTTSNDFMEMSILAMTAGYPGEAKAIVDQGFQSGVLGTGPEAGRHQRLRDMATKKASDNLKMMAHNEVEAGKSKEGTELVGIGYDYVTIAQFDKGISLMEQGIRKGETKRIEDAKLHMAIAYALAGRKANAIQMFKTVQGTDGTADLARYWILHLTSRPDQLQSMDNAPKGG